MLPLWKAVKILKAGGGFNAELVKLAEKVVEDAQVETIEADVPDEPEDLTAPKIP